MMRLTAEMASRFAGIALDHVQREYPNKLDHVFNGPEDVRAPRELHPVFYGSFDWHSNVHGYWLLGTLLRQFPEIPQAGQIRALFDAQMTPDKVAVEVAYLEQPSRATFERPYGWAWLLMLCAELARHADPAGRRWSRAIAPLGVSFASRFKAFLPKAKYPIRVGTHFNTAFALSLTIEFSAAASDDSLASLVRDTAQRWYDSDADCQAWEPGGDDFLSPSLIEAECMHRVMPAATWSAWLDRFLPRLAAGEPAALFAPAEVSDRSDGKIAHLDGLNLSRAWCFRALAAALPTHDPRRARMSASAEEHLAASLPHVGDDYAGSHWLATYAVLALSAGDDRPA
jgi:hypothetical protein